jgi:Cobalamin adenosyltransferase
MYSISQKLRNSSALLLVILVLLRGASSLAGGNWSVKDDDLIEVVGRVEEINKEIRTAAQAIQTRTFNIQTATFKISDKLGTDTDSAITRLRTIDNKVITIDGKLNIPATVLKDNSVTLFTRIEETVSLGVTRTLKVDYHEAPVIDCGDKRFEFKMPTTIEDAAKDYLPKLGDFYKKWTQSEKSLTEACKDINFEVAQMYAENKSFEEQIKLLQTAINTFNITPSTPSGASGTTGTTYGGLAAMSFNLQTIQASQANIIGIHASNIEMYKMRITAAKEEYMRLSLKKLLG